MKKEDVKVGQKVRRINDKHGKMQVGSIGIVTGIHKYVPDNFYIDNDFDHSHRSFNLELVEDVKTDNYDIF